MPYIKSGDGRREALQKGEPALSAGELNYQIFYYVQSIFKTGNCFFIYSPNNYLTINNFILQFLGEKPNYQKYNDMTGVMIRCYKELERRLEIDVKQGFIQLMENYDNVIAEYEDKKCKENGDVE